MLMTLNLHKHQNQLKMQFIRCKHYLLPFGQIMMMNNEYSVDSQLSIT